MHQYLTQWWINPKLYIYYIFSTSWAIVSSKRIISHYTDLFKYKWKEKTFGIYNFIQVFRMLSVTRSSIFIKNAVFPEIPRFISLTKLIRYVQNDYFYFRFEKSPKISIKSKKNNNKLGAVQ